MKTPNKPINELERLKVLHSYRVLDTPTESAFDDLTLLASQICGTPIALVSLIDESRQWFKSHKGLDATETHRDISFCGHAILESDTFIIEDALKDERFSDNPLVIDSPLIRFYAGAQLTSPDGYNIGTLCVIDHQPKKLTSEQIEALNALARKVVSELELRKALENVKKEKEQLVATQKIVTEQQAKLVAASKFSALGEMAGGIAHEINNPLAIIEGKTSNLIYEAETDLIQKEKLIKDLGRIQMTVDRISKIVKGLSSYSRNSEKDSFEGSSLEKIINDSLDLCREKITKKDIQLKLNIQDDLKIMCRPQQIGQIIINLLSNSLDAIEHLEEKWIEVNTEKLGNAILIKVTDSGSGIPMLIQDKLMDPFFTTKEVGKGTGLGLSISKGIAEEHGGSLTLNSTSPRTQFILKLPAAR